VRSDPQLARGVVARRGELGPILQAARLLQPGASMSRAKSISCAEPSVVPRNWTPAFRELVRLVEDRDLDARQQLGDSAVAQRHVGEEEVMVDDDDVGEHRLAARLHDVAAAVLGTLGAEAVLARRRHQRDDAAALVEPRQLGEIAARRRLRPRLDLGERAHGSAVGQLRVVARKREPVQAEIARPALQQCDRDRQLERAAQARQIADEELVLQRLGRSAEQRARAAEERGNEVREGLADASAGLDDERAAPFDRIRDGERHVALHGALGVARVGRGERARAAERVPDRLLQRRRRRLLRSRRRRHAGRSGSSSDSMRVILSRRISLRFFSRRSVRSSVVASSSARSIRSSRSACSIRSSISRRGRECKSSSMDSSDSRLVRGFGPLAQYQTDYSFWP
jgi:hypothetical protein